MPLAAVQSPAPAEEIMKLFLFAVALLRAQLRAQLRHC